MDLDPRAHPISPAKTAATTSSSRTGKSFFDNIIRKESKLSRQQQDSPKGSYGLTVLHDPVIDTPVVDLIFVHGLNGGSQSTWTKGPDSNFWPKFWLPHDDAFADVRIHTFGYHSSVSRESVLNIQDFSRFLLGAICDAPTIPRSQNVPLVLIGHSMGGLVIKKAYVLAHNTSEFNHLVERICAMFFLGVPHRGAEIAQALNRLLALQGARPFVNDLLPSSPALESLNDEFPLFSNKLRLFSFFETRPMNYGIGKGLIVEKTAAVLNYVNERRTYLDANHRDVARFSSVDDPSYLTIRNALATLISEQRDRNLVNLYEDGDQETLWENIDAHKIDTLSTFLGVHDAPEDDLMNMDSLRLPGSCEWLIQRPKFKEWRDTRSSGMYWLRGRPGAGKSIISSAVISHLRDISRECCFFFFIEGDKGKVSTKNFLKSMAFQMAILHPEILRTILDIASKWGEVTLDKSDANTIWRKIFLSGVLKARLNRPQYWVVDALDEARDGSDLVSFLSKAREYWPLCIFVTSRNSIDSYKGILAMRMEMITDTMTEDDTHTDISLFLDSNSDRFPAATFEDRKEMAQRILKNSRGCFLWAQLVVKELLQVRTITQADQVINRNPSDMDTLYLKILSDMSENKFNRELIKAILTWAVCSSRPLDMDELKQAIQLDIRDEIGDMERSINDSCGNLVYVDQLKKLQLVHLTARELLVRDSLISEYRIDRGRAHRRLAMVCLEYLLGQEKKPTKSSRLRKMGVASPQQNSSPFENYATSYLFHHLSHARSYDDELLILLTKFLRSTCVLGWIEHIAKRSELQIIFQAGKVIDQILQRRAENSPPIGVHEERSCMAQWANDFMRLATKFGKRLTATPYAIHHLIPPFCPAQSAIHQQFCSPRNLEVAGINSNNWDDCLSMVSYAKPTRPYAIATSPKNIALGDSKGKVTLCDGNTFQETAVIEHTEPVWSVTFSEKGFLVAMAGARSVQIWDVQRDILKHTLPTKSMCLALAFGDDDRTFWAVLRSNIILSWDIETGELRTDAVNWTTDFEEEGSELHARVPVLASFCMHQGLLAVVYRGEDLILWEIEEERVFDIYEKEMGSRLNGSTKQADGATSIWDVAFSEAPGTSLLAAAYSDGDLVVYGTEDGNVVNILTSVYPQKLCCSPDGRTLASGDSRGNIQLFDFQTLKFLYRIQFEADALKIRSLTFTLDNLRLIEIRGNQCRIWEPSVLLRQDVDDNSSDTISITTAPLEIEYEAPQARNITAIACTHSLPFVFCGKEDGTIHVYDTTQDSCSQQMFMQTKNCPIILLHFDSSSDILVCCDAATRITARRVTKRPGEEWLTSDVLLDIRPAKRVLQLLSSGKHNRILVATDEHNTLWPLGTQGSESTFVKRINGTNRPCWVSHVDSRNVILVEETGARVFSWMFLEHITTISFTSMDPPSISSIINLQHSRFFATISTDAVGTTSNNRHAIHVWDMDEFDATDLNCTVKPAFDLGTLTFKVEQAIGVVNDRLVFLDKDYWVCSIDLATARDISRKRGITTGSVATARQGYGQRQSMLSSSDTVVRHFFVPYDWISMVTKLNTGGVWSFAKQALFTQDARQLPPPVYLLGRH
ncbi:hypothetical protein F5B20DRAFT_586079 [Whalleya microplaca]|nr:hypothetical protein F5B20DRAFT_586079 [Whalleya microplaca]